MSHQYNARHANCFRISIDLKMIILKLESIKKEIIDNEIEKKHALT